MSRISFVTSIIVLLTILSISAAFSESDIQIARPLDRSTVRETVNVMVPESSVPTGGFVGFSIDGTFRVAGVSKSADGKCFVYRWDTKATYKDPNAMDVELPWDGEHKILVQAFNSSGEKDGKPKTIIVFVSNNASKLMPASGLKLRYRLKLGSTNYMRFKYTLDIKKIQGGSAIAAAVGEAVEGATGIVRRSVEDIMTGGSVLIRQKLMGNLQVYQGGRPTPIISPVRSVYDTENNLGIIGDILKTTSNGIGVSLDMPNLPSQKVRVGYSWTHTENVFRNVVTGKATTLKNVNSTVEGLEWEHGYPCVKIKSVFSNVKMPIEFSNYFKGDVLVTEGYTTTYFAYDTGKLVSSVTKAKATATVDQSVITSLTQSILPQGMTYSPSSGANMPMMSSGIEGPPGMENTPPPGSTYNRSTSPGGTEGQTVDVEMEINQVLEPASK